MVELSNQVTLSWRERKGKRSTHEVRLRESCGFNSRLVHHFRQVKRQPTRQSVARLPAGQGLSPPVATKPAESQGGSLATGVDMVNSPTTLTRSLQAEIGISPAGKQGSVSVAPSTLVLDYPAPVATVDYVL